MELISIKLVVGMVGIKYLLRCVCAYSFEAKFEADSGRGSRSTRGRTSGDAASTWGTPPRHEANSLPRAEPYFVGFLARSKQPQSEPCTSCRLRSQWACKRFMFLLYTGFGSMWGDMPRLDPQRASSLCLGVSSLGLLQVEAARPEAALMDTELIKHTGYVIKRFYYSFLT